MMVHPDTVSKLDELVSRDAPNKCNSVKPVSAKEADGGIVIKVDPKPLVIGIFSDKDTADCLGNDVSSVMAHVGIEHMSLESGLLNHL